MKVVRIYPKTNFHTFLNSDTLWGNLIYAYKMLYGFNETSNLIKDDNSSFPTSPLRVSSIFPYEIIKNENANSSEEYIYYFPKPITGKNIREANDPEEMTYMKDFKKIRYVEQKTFEEYLNGEIDDNNLFERFLIWQKELQKKEAEQNKELIEKNSFKFKKLLEPTFNLHNSIDRMSGSTLQAAGRGQLYWEEEFASFGNQLVKTKEVKNGIYFLIDDDNVSLVEAPLRLLSDIGIGGNKSIGKGSFEFEIDDFAFNQNGTYNSYISLSLYQPNKREIDLLKDKNVKLFYDITTRFGKVGRDFNLEFQDKNPVICFTEGSTFFTKEQLYGRLVATAKFNDEQDIYSSYLFFGVKANLRIQWK